MRQAISPIAVILPLGIALAFAGCRSKTTEPPKLAVGKNATVQKPGEPDPAEQRTQFIGNLLESLNNRSVDAELFTPSFKKKIARPRHGNDDDKQAG